MKKSILARGFIGSVASLLGVVAVGCSADVMDQGAAGDSAEIGSTSQALTLQTNGSNPPDLAVGQRSDFSSSCVFTSGSDSFFIKAGGFTAAGGTPTDDILLLKKITSVNPPVHTWVLQNAALTVANGQAQAFQVDATHCVIIGGASGVDGSGAAIANVDLLTFNPALADASKVSVTPLESLAEARADHRVSVCKDTDQSDNLHIVVAGGRTQNTFRQTIEVSRKLSDVVADAASLWRTTTNDLATARANFGFDTNGANGYMVAGGQNAGSAALRSVELIRMSEVTDDNIKYCDIPDADEDEDNRLQFLTGLSGVTTGTTARFVDALGEFVVAFGRNPSGTPSLFGGERLTANFGVSPMTLSAPTTDNPPAGAYRPVEVRVDADTIAYLGGANAAVNASVISVQEYTASGWATSVNLSGAMYGASAGLMLGSEVYIAAGATPPGTLVSTVDAISVP